MFDVTIVFSFLLVTDNKVVTEFLASNAYLRFAYKFDVCSSHLFLWVLKLDVRGSYKYAIISNY